ncbi:MAG: hypothetical protein ACQERU_07740 [Bacteroidota bacterium]
MKVAITLLIIVALSIFCCTKEKDNELSNYHSFIGQGKIWSNGLLGYDSSEDEYYPVKSDYIKIGYDTIIEGNNWYTVQKSNDKNHEKWENWGYIREDSKKIYYKWNEEIKLLYDFGLNTGDEIELMSTTYSVDSVKYLPILNNEKRKHIFLSINNSSSSGYVVWVESIGSNCGFFENTGNTQSFGGLNKLLCCEVNGIYLYKDSIFNMCYFDHE